MEKLHKGSQARERQLRGQSFGVMDGVVLENLFTKREMQLQLIFRQRADL